MEVSVGQEKDPTGNPQILETLTARLPEWFARRESNKHYAKQAEVLEAWVARIGGRPGGLLLLKGAAPVNAEIYWLGMNRTIIGRESERPCSAR